jgi:hypothetical protein
MHIDRGLRRELLMVLCLKVLALAALWWIFFRGHGVSIDAGPTLERLTGAGPTSASGFEAGVAADNRIRSNAR